MRALDLMTPRPRVVTPDQPLIRAAEIMRDLDIGFVPVVEDYERMRVVGVITDRDIAIRHVAAGHHDCPARDVMTRAPLQIVEPDDSIETVLSKMHREKVRRLLVTASNGRLLGVVALADLALHAGLEYRTAVERVLASLSEPMVLQR